MCWNRSSVLAAIALLAATAGAQEAPTVAELRAALNDVTTRSDALDEIARYWEGRDELESDVRALVPANWRASWALGTKRRVAKESIAILAAHLQHQEATRWALAQIGEPALPALRAALSDPNRAEGACIALQRLKPPARELASFIAPLAIDGNAEARRALAKMAPVGGPLLRALQDTDAEDDYELLCYVGPQTFPKLDKLAKGDRRVARQIAFVLFQHAYGAGYFLDAKSGRAFLAQMGALAIPEILRALPRELAFEALERMKIRAPWAEGAVREFLDGEHQELALAALSGIGASERETVRWIESNFAQLRFRATSDAVDALGRGNTVAGRALMARLIDNAGRISPGARKRMFLHLARQDPARLKPKLAALIDDRSASISIRAELFALVSSHEAADETRFRQRCATLKLKDRSRLLEDAVEMGWTHDALTDIAAITANHATDPEVRAEAIVVLAHRGRSKKEHYDWLAAQIEKGEFHASRALRRLPADDEQARELIVRLAKEGAAMAWMAIRDWPGVIPIEDFKPRSKYRLGYLVAWRGPRSHAEFQLAQGVPRLPFPIKPTEQQRALWKEHLTAGSGARQYAAYLLEKGGTTDDIPALRRCLLDNITDVRIAAWDAIEAIEARAAR
ncbi:MAG: hypothetical protein V3T86_10845 [Planctomycetota bacterium]